MTNDNPIRDLMVLGRRHDYDDCVPQADRYLFKYFSSGARRAFLRYYMLLGDATRFALHTGHNINRRGLRRWKAELKRLQERRAAYRAAGDLEALARLESGEDRGASAT